MVPSRQSNEETLVDSLPTGIEEREKRGLLTVGKYRDYQSQSEERAGGPFRSVSEVSGLELGVEGGVR